jgi:hypothetical protein
LTTPESEEQAKTAPIDLPPIPPAPPPSRARKSAAPRPTDDPPSAAAPEPPTLAAEEPSPAEESLTVPPTEPPHAVATTAVVDPTFVVRPASRLEQEVLFVPLAVSVGDGFKFGCGFFLALVLAMLIGFVLFAALFVLTSLFGLNLPISR